MTHIPSEMVQMSRDGIQMLGNPENELYRDETTPGMRANRTIPLSELTQKYGNQNSCKLYHKDDLICRFMHQWGVDYMKNGWE